MSKSVRAGLLLAFTLLLAPFAARAQQATQATKPRAHDAAKASSAQASPPSPQSDTAAELPNFHQVNPRLYRGAQPREGGLKRLAALGVKTVINLRDDDDRAQDEEREARALGLRYFNVPISRAGRPSEARIKELMSIVDAKANQPVFVHCKRGADRTGAFIAVYRITHDGWTGEQALEEAERYGLGFWQRGKKDFIKDYYRDHAAPTSTKQPESQSKSSH
jgi:tyrosine-protein phosphatase SIW14